VQHLLQSGSHLRRGRSVGRGLDTAADVPLAVGHHGRHQRPEVLARQLLQWPVRRKRKLQPPFANALEIAEEVVEEVRGCDHRPSKVLLGEA
jgi:hypothetical protein